MKPSEHQANTPANTQANTPEHQANTTPNTREHHPEHQANKTSYSARELAEYFGVSDATIRTRWGRWLLKAIGEKRAKNPDGSFTRLAYELLCDYDLQVVKGSLNGDQWAREMAQLHPVEIELSEAEVLPDDFEIPKAGSLALRTDGITSGHESNLATASQLNQQVSDLIAIALDFASQDLDAFSDAQAATDAELEELEMQLVKLKAIANYRKQQRVQSETEAALRRADLQKKQAGIVASLSGLQSESA